MSRVEKIDKQIEGLEREKKSLDRRIDVLKRSRSDEMSRYSKTPTSYIYRSDELPNIRFQGGNQI